MPPPCCFAEHRGVRIVGTLTPSAPNFPTDGEAQVHRLSLGCKVKNFDNGAGLLLSTQLVHSGAEIRFLHRLDPQPTPAKFACSTPLSPDHSHDWDARVMVIGDCRPWASGSITSTFSTGQEATAFLTSSSTRISPYGSARLPAIVQCDGSSHDDRRCKLYDEGMDRYYAAKGVPTVRLPNQTCFSPEGCKWAIIKGLGLRRRQEGPGGTSVAALKLPTRLS
jgi:hypothetical protein